MGKEMAEDFVPLRFCAVARLQEGVLLVMLFTDLTLKRLSTKLALP